MSITKILTADAKDKSASEKLNEVAEIVAGARENYGNKDEEVPVKRVNTAYGSMEFTHLEDEAKVEVLRNEAMNIKVAAVAYVEENPGTVINRKIEELLATNPYFANVAEGTKFDYL